jgi:hypothetical protein
MQSRRRSSAWLLAGLLLMLLFGCAHEPPFGISKVEWDRLSKNDQAKYRRLERNEALNELRENQRFFDSTKTLSDPPPFPK